MREHTAFLWIGAWLLVLPFLGIPGSWKDTLTILTAFGFILYALILMRRSRLNELQNTDEGQQQEYSDDGSSSQSM